MKWPFSKMNIGATVIIDAGLASQAQRNIATNRVVYGQLAYMTLDDGSLMVRKFNDEIDLKTASVIMVVNYRDPVFLINGRLCGRDGNVFSLMSERRVGQAIADGWIEVHSDSTVHLTGRGRATLDVYEDVSFCVPSDMVDAVRKAVENAIQHRQ
jgi:hypothetical protein